MRVPEFTIRQKEYKDGILFYWEPKEEK